MEQMKSADASLSVQLWLYRARFVKAIDGDTMDVVIDAGFRSFREERLRLLGINTPEMKRPTREAGESAKAFVEFWMEFAASRVQIEEWPLIVETYKSDVFGRYLATVWRACDGECLNTELLTSGNAVEDIRP